MLDVLMISFLWSILTIDQQPELWIRSYSAVPAILRDRHGYCLLSWRVCLLLHMANQYHFWNLLFVFDSSLSLISIEHTRRRSSLPFAFCLLPYLWLITSIFNIMDSWLVFICWVLLWFEWYISILYFWLARIKICCRLLSSVFYWISSIFSCIKLLFTLFICYFSIVIFLIISTN